jgi:hypothetical protein
MNEDVSYRQFDGIDGSVEIPNIGELASLP